MRHYKLNKDWADFEPALRHELEKLNATKEETELILEGAWQDATDVGDVARYAADELELLRDPDMPNYK